MQSGVHVIGSGLCHSDRLRCDTLSFKAAMRFRIVALFVGICWLPLHGQSPSTKPLEVSYQQFTLSNGLTIDEVWERVEAK